MEASLGSPRPLALLISCAAALAGCHPTGNVAASGSVTYECPATTAEIQEKLLAPTCGLAGCHAAMAPALSLDLMSPGLEQRISNAPSNGCGDKTIVVPGDPGRSYMFEKLEQASPVCGDRMPLQLAPLSAEQIACLKSWVSSISLPDGGSGGHGGSTGSGGQNGSAGSDGGAVDAAKADASGCAAGQQSCGGKCATVATDNANCGACGHVCGAGQTCSGGVCACPGGMAACGGACVDTQTSVGNCGACGKVCTAGEICAAGLCTCQAGLSPCGMSCVDLATSAANCGACGVSCGGGVCASGKCAASCPAGTTNCSGSCVTLATSPTNCGACGKVCGAGMSCVAGSCACPAGTTLCGSTCVSTGTDASNCGACGHSCPAGTSCSAGVCACPSGQTHCGSTCVDTATDPANCGACGKACAAGQLCAAGACGCGATVSFTNQVQPIFTASCTNNGCHSSGNKPAASLSLVAGASYGALVNVASTCAGKMRVVPSSVPASYLMNKLTGVGICSGTQMPKTGQSLSKAELDAISGWICEGAPKN
jgi:hypothetical protein